jgi:hypothetical protein
LTNRPEERLELSSSSCCNPYRLLPALAALGEIGQQALAKRWAESMSEPDHPHSVDGKRISDDWTTDCAIYLLEPIVRLVKQATSGEAMYLLIE